MAERKSVTEMIRKTIQARGISGYLIEKKSGISQGGVSRFLRGQRDIRGAQIDRLCEYLGLELREKK